MNKTDFLCLNSLSHGQLAQLLRRAGEMKASPRNSDILQQQTLLLLFEHPSTRTRLSFEVGMNQMGGRSLFVTQLDAQLSRGEPLEDVARVAGGMVNAVAMRTGSHDNLVTFAEHCRVPVINALSDRLHPCQTLADLLTLQEEFATLKDLTVAWVGDGNNSLNSWLEASALFGFRLHYACPKGYEPDPVLSERATSARACATPQEAASGAQAISTDVWVSMGQDSEQDERKRDFAPYQVNAEVLAEAADNAIVLHCLPAHRGLETTAEVLEGAQSRVWAQAENRLHAQKALLELLLAS